MKRLFRKDKKGIANLIGIIILIVLSITAIGTLGILIKSLSDNILSSPEFSCIDIEAAPPIRIKTSCYNSGSNSLEVTLSRSLSSLEITSLEIVSNNEKFACGNFCGSCEILNSGEKIYSLELENPFEKNEVSLKINNCFIETKEVLNC